MTNTSGQGKGTAVPEEIRGWNWGAFLLNWIWGIGNKTYIALLMFVPFVNMAMPFVLGAKGNEWAWRNNHWDSVEAFKRTQRKWGVWGGVAILAFLLLFGGIFSGVMYMMKQSGAYRLALRKVTSHPAASEILGSPVETGWFVSGNTKTSGPSGEANISFTVSGPRGSGTVYAYALKRMGEWRAKNVVFHNDADNRRIVIVRKR